MSTFLAYLAILAVGMVMGGACDYNQHKGECPPSMPIGVILFIITMLLYLGGKLT